MIKDIYSNDLYHVACPVENHLKGWLKSLTTSIPMYIFEYYKSELYERPH
jgi:hypothetical protein